MRSGNYMRRVAISLLTLLSYHYCFRSAFAQSVSWTRTDTLLSDGVQTIAVADSSKLFVGAGWAIYSSTNMGDNWVHVMNMVYATSMLYGPDSLLYAGTVGGYVMFSADRGMSWQFSAAFCTYPLGVIALDLQGRLLAGAQGGSQNFPGGLYRSGVHAPCCWGHIHISFPWEPTINAIIVTQDSTILVNGFRSTDDGVSWTAGSPSWATTSFALRPDNSLVAGGPSGIYLSSDDGATWTTAVPGLPSVPVNILVQNRLGLLFAGTTAGVYSSNDGGFTWTAINDGLTQLNVHALAVDSAGYLYAGTDVGVFRSIGPTTSIDKQSDFRPSNFSLSQNYPNPFNPTTSIRFDLATASHVTLKVYDMLGRQVSVIVNEEMQAGVHEVIYGSSNLASGVYIYRLQAGSFTQSRKMMLLR